MLIPRGNKWVMTRRSMLAVGAAATALGFVPKPLWATPHRPGGAIGGPVTPTDALSELLLGMTANTWKRVTNQGGQPNSSYAQACYLNQPSAPDYNGTTALSIGSQACSSLMGVYESTAYDSYANRFIIGAGGGHGQAASNELLQFDFASLKWSRLTTPDIPVQTFSAQGSIPASSSPPYYQQVVMTITSVNSGWIAPNVPLSWTSPPTDQHVSGATVINQLTGPSGGAGTYTVESVYGFPAGISGEIHSISNSTADNQAVPGGTLNATLVNPNCPNYEFDPISGHTYGGFRWVPNFPTARGCIIVSELRNAQWAIWDCNSVPNNSSPVLPSGGLNWEPPSLPLDPVHGNLPRGWNGGSIGACASGGWRLARGPNTVFNTIPSQPSDVFYPGSACPVPGLPLGQAKMLQLGNLIGGGPPYSALVYDFATDTITPASVQSYSPGLDTGASVTVRGNIAEGWLTGQYPTNDAPYKGLCKYNLLTGARTDYTPTNPSNGDLWVISSVDPYIGWHPGDGVRGDRFMVIGTTAGGNNFRNTSAYGGVSAGNIFDMIDPATGQINEIVTGGDVLPFDLSFQAQNGGNPANSGFGNKLVWDAVHKCVVMISGYLDPSGQMAYVYKPGPNFPYSA